MKRVIQALIIVAVTYAVWLVSEPPTPPAFWTPKYENGSNLTLSLVENTLFENFAEHGLEFHQARQTYYKDTKEFATIDDLAVSLDKLGRSAEAIPILEGKLKAQQDLEQEGRQLYTTYANLGTVMIHEALPGVFGGDPSSIEQMEQGLEWVKKSLAVNPEAHFGREEWQVHIAAFILEAAKSPEILTQRDFIGNQLDPQRAPGGDHHKPGWTQDKSKLKPRERRKYITEVGSGVPFDEPLLAIVGMWRYGGGANPHFSLAMAETLDRVGELELAWFAHNRTILLAERFWPEKDLQAWLRDYCEKRKSLLEKALDKAPEALDSAFSSKLAEGLAFKKSFQEFEIQHLEGSGYDPDFDLFEAFDKSAQGI